MCNIIKYVWRITGMNLLELLKQYAPEKKDKKIDIKTLYIVSPYLNQGFFEGVFTHFKFDNITLFIDKSQYNKAEAIKKQLVEDGHKINNKFEIIPVTDEKNRLVHAKIYYFEICSGEQVHTYLITGSSNASNRAFSFGIKNNNDHFKENYSNAEINIVVRIYSKKRKFFNQYFQAIKNNSKLDNYVFKPLNNDEVIIHFPKLKTYNDITEDMYVIEADSFQNWIESGFIYHKYDVLQDLGKVRINLKSISEIKNDFVEKARTQGFDLDEGISSISYKFIDDKNVTKNISQINIKATYLFDTPYGLWTAKEFHNIINNQNNESPKYEIISKIANMNIDDTIQDILAKFIKFANSFQKDEREHYFYITKDKDIDAEKYKDIIEKQLNKQKNKCEDESFQNRAKTNYGSYNASVLEPYIDELMEEIVKTVKLELHNNRVNSILAKVLKTAIKNKVLPFSDITVDYIDKNWETISKAMSKRIQNNNMKN